jgi:hypothetical protein
MANKTWKQCERVIAKRLGGVRTGPTGRGGPDILALHLAVEVKTRKTLPAWLKEAVRQAVAGAGGDRLPLALLHEAGQRHDDDIACMRLVDLERLLCLGNGPGAPGDEQSLTQDSGGDHDGYER